MHHSETVGKLQRTSRQMQRGTVPRLPPHLQLLPGDTVLNAGPKRLRPSLLRGETRGKALREALFASAIGNLLRSKDPFQKTVAKAIDRLRNALDFHNVDSGANKHEQIFLHAR